MKRLISIFLVCVLAVGLAACSKPMLIEETTQAEQQEVSRTFSSELQELPESYYNSIKGKSTVEAVEYTHNDHTKKVAVYLPPSYSESKQYDVLYILPGSTGDYTTYFELDGNVSKFECLLDNMITNGDMNPCIVVAACFYPKERDNSVQTLDVLLSDFTEELTQIIIPTVETKYSTYTKSTNKNDIISAREHRGYAGCSMGGAFVWDGLANNLEYFKYYAPTAAGSFEDYYSDYDGIGVKITNELNEKGYAKDDFFVFGCDGTDDVTYEKMETIIARLKENNSDIFTFTDNDMNAGNITYKVLEHGEHNMDTMYVYLYNALQTFWK